MFLAQLLYNSNNFFLRSTIEYFEPTCRKTNLMVDYKKKKKIVRVVQKLCESYAINITHLLKKTRSGYTASHSGVEVPKGAWSRYDTFTTSVQLQQLFCQTNYLICFPACRCYISNG
jgi:hypothetical protein